MLMRALASFARAGEDVPFGRILDVPADEAALLMEQGLAAPFAVPGTVERRDPGSADVRV